MRHFRGSRGTRRGSLPRSTLRSAKYIVVSGPSSEAAGIQAVVVAKGVDNAALGQTGPTDTSIPVGAKISKIEIFMPKVNLGAATANFITWTLQRTLTGQSVINPISAAGDAKRTNIMLTGVLGLGAGQNNQLHITYKVPPKFQRMQDDMFWNLVMDNGLAVSTFYYIIYKIFM